MSAGKRATTPCRRTRSTACWFLARQGRQAGGKTQGDDPSVFGRGGEGASRSSSRRASISRSCRASLRPGGHSSRGSRPTWSLHDGSTQLDWRRALARPETDGRDYMGVGALPGICGERSATDCRRSANALVRTAPPELSAFADVDPLWICRSRRGGEFRPALLDRRRSRDAARAARLVRAKGRSADLSDAPRIRLDSISLRASSTWALSRIDRRTCRRLLDEPGGIAR